MAAAERSGALGLLRALLRRTPATPPVAADLPFGARSDRPAAASRALFHAYRKAGRFYNELSRWNLLPADRALHESLLDVLTLMQERGWGVDPGKPQPTRPQQAHEQQGG